ncbi:MAG TPA: NUDIX domain-containing protein [Armatimonadota bacterium]
MADYHKAGLVALRGERMLLCKKRDLNSKLILPGGRFEEGESAEQCLRREVREELGAVSLGPIEYIGTYKDRAASDDPTVVKTVEIELYRGELIGEPVASMEIVELIWFGPNSDKDQLSPILINHIVPDLLKRSLLPWKNN